MRPSARLEAVGQVAEALIALRILSGAEVAGLVAAAAPSASRGS